jgi:hypothetical protein
MTGLRYDPERGERIPLARDELMKIASYLRDCGIDGMEKPAAHIEDIVNELMWRRSKKKRTARAKVVTWTSELVRDIQASLLLNPSKHEREIGRMHGVDGGRISEVVQGQRTVEHPNGTPEWRGVKP